MQSPLRFRAHSFEYRVRGKRPVLNPPKSLHSPGSEQPRVRTYDGRLFEEVHFPLNRTEGSLDGDHFAFRFFGDFPVFKDWPVAD